MATGVETLVPLSVVARMIPSLDPVAVTHIGYAGSASLALELASCVSLSQARYILLVGNVQHKCICPAIFG